MIMQIEEICSYLEAIVSRDLVVRMGESGEYVVAIQTALLSAGHEIVTDGDFLPMTWTAVRHFQAVRGLRHDGQVGANTAAAMLDWIEQRGKTKPIAPALPSVLEVAPHLARMRAASAAKEFPGSENNPLIMFWVDAISMLYPELAGDISWYDGDEIAWCGLGMAAAVALGVPSFEPPRDLLAAASWGDWGEPLMQLTPGAVMVFEREGGNHVALYESEDDDHYYVRGANQSDMINVAARAKSGKPWAIRWLPGALVPEAGPKSGATKMAGT